VEKFGGILARVVNAPGSGQTDHEPRGTDEHRGRLLDRVHSKLLACANGVTAHAVEAPDVADAGIQYFSATGLTSKLAIKPTTSKPDMMCRMTG
jgi:hypothetical protein